MNQNQKTILLVVITIIAIFGVVGIYTNNHKADFTPKTQITDMADRNVSVPAEVSRAVSITFSVTVPLYMLAPDKMIAWNSNLTENQKRYIPTKYQNLPVMGGGKGDANYESFMTLNPDVVFIGHGGNDGSVYTTQQKFGQIPVIDVEGDNNITNITASIKFLGAVLGEEKKADELTGFYEKVMEDVNNTTSKIPQSEKKRVYYARDPTGLMSSPPGSSHTQLIELCGGVNVADVPLTKGSAQISIEQIIEWNPDIIIAKDPQFYKNVYSNPVWQNVKAVKEKQVYLVPNSPFNWFEGPPGANSIIGIPWTAKVLYPDKFKELDLKNLTKEFYSNFYHYNLTDKEVTDLLTTSGLKNP